MLSVIWPTMTCLNEPAAATNSSMATTPMVMSSAVSSVRRR
jgi:hypothetical protein